MVEASSHEKEGSCRNVAENRKFSDREYSNKYRKCLKRKRALLV